MACELGMGVGVAVVWVPVVAVLVCWHTKLPTCGGGGTGTGGPGARPLLTGADHQGQRGQRERPAGRGHVFPSAARRRSHR